MKLALSLQLLPILALLARAVPVPSFSDKYDPLLQSCFSHSIRCTQLSHCRHDFSKANLATASQKSHAHSPTVHATSCSAHASEIMDLRDDGSCVAEVTAISAITDGCLDGVSAFMVSLCRDELQAYV